MVITSLPRRKRSVRCRFFRPRLEWLENRLPPAANAPAGLANAIPLNNDVGQVLTGSLGPGQANDYSLSVTQDTYLIATAVPEGSPGFEPRLTLYDATGQLLIESDQQAPGLTSATLEQHLQPGTYYLGVSAAASTSVAASKEAYQLATAVSSSPPPFAPNPDVGGVLADLRGDGIEDMVGGAIAVADLGNGHLDVITSGTVSVLLGNGDGTFQPVKYYAVASPGTPAVLLGNGDGSFEPGKPVAVPQGSNIVAVADLLGNGIQDVVAANDSANTVSVLLGNGDGTFQPAKSFAVPKGSTFAAVTDLRGNGIDDILTANSQASTMSVLLGNGDGTFRPAESFAVPKGSTFAAVADLRGDGIEDIVTSNSPSNTVSVLLGNGDGTFQPPQSYAVDVPANPVYPYIASVAVADLGNGHPDIVTSGGSSSVSVLFGNGDGTFQPAKYLAVATSGYTSAATVVDLGNGHPDIVAFTEFADTVSVFLGNGDGTFQPPRSYAMGQSYGGLVAVANLGNGHPDIITGNLPPRGPGPTFSILMGNGDGTFRTTTPVAVGQGPDSVAVADLGNGRPDIITSNAFDSTVSVLLGNGDGTFQQPETYSVGPGTSPQQLVVADVNGDGRPDLITDNNFGTISVLLGNGDGTFQPVLNFPDPDAGWAVAVADLGNGHADIVTTNGDGIVSVLLGNGDGTFQAPQSYPVRSSGSSVAVADLRGDGIEDIVTSGGSGVSVLLGNGDGTFQHARSFAVPDYGAGSLAVADLRGDGIEDIVTEGPSGVWVLLGNGDGTFQPAQSYPVPDQAFGSQAEEQVAVADLNGDGIPDIVAANSYPGGVSVLLGNGDGTFQPPRFFATGSTDAYSVAVADLNGDGRLDIVATSIFDNTVSVLLNQGDGEFQAPAGPTGVPGRNVPQLQDLTGNGIPDAVSLDQNTGQILFRRGTGDPNNPYAPLSVVNPGVPATDFTLVQSQGLPEIAALDTVDQQVVLYAWSSAAGKFLEAGAFATGPHPVRIASADLDGNGLGDLVIGNDGDNTVTIALQQPGGSFNTFTRSVGAGPSSITFADMNGDGLLDIVVSDQVSGDVSILFNDASHSFTTQERYRAGQGPFDADTGPGGSSLVSQLETIGVVAGDFTGNGSTDLVTLNANADSFSLLRAAGGGALIDPQAADTRLVGQGEVQALVGDFTGDGRDDLAILQTLPNPTSPTQPGASQLLIYPNNGNGTFGTPVVSDAGQGATGFTFVPGLPGPTAHPQPAEFLIGDAYGDFLTLIPDPSGPAGAFQIDRGNLDGAPLAVGTTAAGQTFVVLADQSQDQVQVFLPPQQTVVGPQVPSVRELTPFATIDSNAQTPALLAPGAVQLVDLNEDPSKDPTEDLIVASRLGNDVLVYPGLGNGTFGPPQSFPVGFEPTAFTVGDFTDDGGVDLAVANQGSNDVSILLSSYDSAGDWTGFTDGPRLASGGSEPVGVQAGEFTGRPGIVDLNVTNAGGQIATLPGIGSDGKGTGFFQDNQPITFDVPGTPIGPVSDGLLATTQGIYQIDPSAATATQVFASTDLTAIGVGANGDVVAGFDDGTLGLLTPTRTGSLAESLIFRDAALTDPSSLQLVSSGGQTEIYATSAGQDRVFVFALSEGIAVPDFNSPFASRGQSAELQPASETGIIFLLANIVTNAAADNPIPASAADESSSGFGGVGVGASSLGIGEGGFSSAVPFVPGVDELHRVSAVAAGSPPGLSASPLEGYIFGVGEGIDNIRRQIRDQRNGQPAPESNEDAPEACPDAPKGLERPQGAESAGGPVTVALPAAGLWIELPGREEWLDGVCLALLFAGVRSEPEPAVAPKGPNKPAHGNARRRPGS